MPDIKYTDISEACRYMGCSGEPDEKVRALAEQYAERVEKAARPAYIFKPLDSLLYEKILVGEDIKRHVEGCSEIILFAATLGVGVDSLIRKESALSAAGALAADAAASACIEGFCRAADREMSRRFESKYLTWRFSPGYGDMPLAQTREICAVLSADKTIGLTVSQSGIMIPRKSVTAIMGISREPVSRRPSGCAACSMRGRCALSKEQRPSDAAGRQDTAERTDS